MTEDNRRVYVGNLAWRVKWQDLKDHMKQVGEVKYAEVMQSNGKSKGCGIVEFADSESAARAIAELNDSELYDRKMFVREDRENRDVAVMGAGPGPGPTPGVARNTADTVKRNGNDKFYGRGSGEVRVPRVRKETQGRQLYVSNLPWSIGWQELKNLFGGSEEVERADIACDRDGRSKGFGYVIMKSEEASVEAANRMNGQEVSGRQIGVKIDNGPPENRSPEE